MNIDRLEPSRPGVFKPVRDSCGSEHRFSCHSFDHVVTDEKTCLSGDNQEGFVIWMHMQSRPLSGSVVTISQNRDRPIDGFSQASTTPGTRNRGVKNCSLGRSTAIGLHCFGIEISSGHWLPPKHWPSEGPRDKAIPISDRQPCSCLGLASNPKCLTVGCAFPCKTRDPYFASFGEKYQACLISPSLMRFPVILLMGEQDIHQDQYQRDISGVPTLARVKVPPRIKDPEPARLAA